MRNSTFRACFACAKWLFYPRHARKSRMRRSIYFRARRVWNSYFAHGKQTKRRVSHTPLEQIFRYTCGKRAIIARVFLSLSLRSDDKLHPCRHPPLRTLVSKISISSRQTANNLPVTRSIINLRLYVKRNKFLHTWTVIN